MRPRALLPAVGLAIALVAGCSSGGDAERSPGDPVTQQDADALAGLLHRNFTRGGADFVVTAPYGDDTVLTLTGEVDFRHDTGRAQAVTSFGDGRPDDARALFFTAEDIWVGDLPGLPQALAAAGAPGAGYLHRPLTAGDEGAVPPLVDVLVEVLLNLSARTADEPRSFVDAGYTWEGQRSIDSRLTSLFALKGGRTVAVAASDDLLTQFVTPVAGGEVDVTVTLSDHGSRTLPGPPEAETAEAADHPEIAATFGI
ncbi:hypothetical protein [Blastococcus sp. CT_GayMR16]|uniref:hypothetical protein n=1 Tax=Blastococcus sp. CT_GayMR16 TaxID=2559607 RepID=UPI0010749ED4|nr:hypothetical protein [Blastococcus sp. CT_GayMR16]TFV88009.1 hypothetical protein E4P38_12095 [Blastococcus sp. CT_GayMR16]